MKNVKIIPVSSLPENPSSDCFYLLLENGSENEGKLKIYHSNQWKDVNISILENDTNTVSEFSDIYITKDSLGSSLEDYVVNSYLPKNSKNKQSIEITPDKLNEYYFTSSELLGVIFQNMFGPTLKYVE